MSRLLALWERLGVALTEIEGPFDVEGVAVLPVPIMHGPQPIHGFRIGAFAYLTDCNHVPESSMALLTGLGCRARQSYETAIPIDDTFPRQPVTGALLGRYEAAPRGSGAAPAIQPGHRRSDGR